LPISEVKTVHYTACKKPFDCSLPYPRNPRDKRQVYRLQELTNVTTCGLFFRKYFEYRRDVEDRVAEKIGIVPSRRDGNYFPEYFMGYCQNAGGYYSIGGIPEDFDMKSIYGF
jgi:hypothetical protein